MSQRFRDLFCSVALAGRLGQLRSEPAERPRRGVALGLDSRTAPGGCVAREIRALRGYWGCEAYASNLSVVAERPTGKILAMVYAALEMLIPQEVAHRAGRAFLEQRDALRLYDDDSA